MTPLAAGRRTGDMDLATVGALLSEPARARILLALGDGRALPASVLASEAGVSTSTASSHLGRLLDAGFLNVRQEGRHRYYELAGPHIAQALELLAGLMPAVQVRSLREGTRAHALRRARMCYDHLGGRLGVGLCHALIERAWVVGGDGLHHRDESGADRLSAPGRDLHYELTPIGARALTELGARLPATRDEAPTPLRYCIDWTEQAHHLSGHVARALAQWMIERAWVERLPRTRALAVTGAGRRELRDRLGIDLDGDPIQHPFRHSPEGYR